MSVDLDRVEVLEGQSAKAYVAWQMAKKALERAELRERNSYMDYVCSIQALEREENPLRVLDFNPKKIAEEE